MHAIEIAMLASEELLILNLACRVSLACVRGLATIRISEYYVQTRRQGSQNPASFLVRRDATVTSRLAMLAGQ